MAEFFSSGRVVDLVLAVMALEVLALWAWHRSGRGIAPIDLWPNLAAGACLLLALRAALAGHSWMWVALALAASGMAHLIDLARRWPAAAPAGGEIRARTGAAAAGGPAGKNL
jgi:hypothetical protein